MRQRRRASDTKPNFCEKTWRHLAKKSNHNELTINYLVNIIL